MMKEAVKLQEKGRDILLNEMDNPNIVHAKSNLHNDVDVGRVIEPAKNADNTFKPGVGQVVLARRRSCARPHIGTAGNKDVAKSPKANKGGREEENHPGIAVRPQRPERLRNNETGGCPATPAKPMTQHGTCLSVSCWDCQEFPRVLKRRQFCSAVRQTKAWGVGGHSDF